MITRRTVLGVGAAGAATVLLPGLGQAATTELVDPYTGAIPMAFPLAEGSYDPQAASEWHVGREGSAAAWNHVNGTAVRAHDGVDTYPPPGVLPPVYAPLTGTVAAVGVRAVNAPDAPVHYAVSESTPPPWNYSRAVDDVAGLPLYGNFVWLRSIEPTSTGYFVLLAHLQDEPVIRSLVPDQPVGPHTRLGVVGDTGNAAGTPQLHTEIHYPVGFDYPCARCTPGRALTCIDPTASLDRAARRPAVAA